MNNPIIENRLVSDRTFAVRLLNFVTHTSVADAPGEEEKQYLHSVALSLLNYQCCTATEDEEIQYLKRLNLPHESNQYKTASE
jgi:hypothetical protein